MGKERGALEPQAQGLPVNRPEDLRGHRRKPRERRRHGARCHRPPPEKHPRAEHDRAVFEARHRDRQALSGPPETPAVTLLHGHEGGDVEVFSGLEEEPLPGLAPGVEHVVVALAPGRVVHLRHDGREGLAVRLEAIVEAHRIEAEPEVAQVREQPHRTGREESGLPAHQAADLLVQRRRRRGARAVVAFPEPGDRRPARGPERETVEYPGELAEVRVDHEHAVGEGMAPRGAAVVHHPSVVEGAVHGAATGPGTGAGARARSAADAGSGAGAGSPAAAPKALHTASALRTPSSWNP